jgi:hypothetical protein
VLTLWVGAALGMGLSGLGTRAPVVAMTAIDETSRLANQSSFAWQIGRQTRAVAAVRAESMRSRTSAVEGRSDRQRSAYSGNS